MTFGVYFRLFAHFFCNNIFTTGDFTEVIDPETGLLAYVMYIPRTTKKDKGGVCFTFLFVAFFNNSVFRL